MCNPVWSAKKIMCFTTLNYKTRPQFHSKHCDLHFICICVFSPRHRQANNHSGTKALISQSIIKQNDFGQRSINGYNVSRHCLEGFRARTRCFLSMVLLTKMQHTKFFLEYICVMCRIGWKEDGLRHFSF